jgi:peptidoglycan/xylan/chitin deacetylase (PgdA/CDA1 family)
VAITVDDGFYGFYRNAREMLRQYGFPATVYVTSYYCSHRAPVFRLAVQYMFWKGRDRPVELAGLGVDVPERPLRRGVELDKAQWALIEYGETQCDEAGRGRLAEEIGRRLGVDYDRIRRTRILHLMTPEELRDLPAAEIDVQLHTHRHQLPDDHAGTLREIAENRAFLVGLLGRPAAHFCYPSGVWSRRQWPWLEEAGVQSAVTCDPGLNDTATPRLALRRFLDGEDIAQIEFEAEVAGFLELLRTARSWMMRLVGRGGRRRATTNI